MNVKILIRAAGRATEQEKAKFIDLVKSRGAVEEKFVREGIERTGAMMVFALIENDVAGVSALKIPLPNYRDGLGRNVKSGYQIQEHRFPYELGYVAVAKEYERNGLGSLLVERVLKLSNGKGIFATTSNPAMIDTILPRAGFQRVGASWTKCKGDGSGECYDLHLMIREPTSRG